MKKIFLTLIMVVVGGVAHASERNPDVVQAEQWLNGMKTGQARFIQTAPDGTQRSGAFHIARPGKLRFEYDDPIEDFVNPTRLLATRWRISCCARI